MSTDLYIVTSILLLFVVTILNMIYLIHSGNILICLISGFISCIVALIAATPVMSFDVLSHTSSTSQISVLEINKISPNNNSATLFNVTYTDAEDINRKITVKEIIYDSNVTYIEKTRKTFLFLYEDNYVLHEPQEFINNN